jgi:hypothetical protein
MINELSQESKNRFPTYVNKWTKIGFDTTPLNKEVVTKDIHNMYKCGGLPPPKDIIFCNGPINAIITINMYMYLNEKPKATKKDVIKYVQKNCTNTSCGYGQHEAGWISFYDFFMNETDLKGLEIIQGLIDVTNSCGWYWAYDTICFVSEKPITCKVNDVNQLHCTDGPACAYNDGTKVFAYDGVIMDEETIMNPSSITTDSIDATENEEQKRIKIEIYGTSKYLHDIKASLVDMDMIKINPFDSGSDSIPRALIKDKNNNLYFVGTDGSTHRTYYMNVPNTVKTCIEAHNMISPVDESNCIASS